MGGNGGTWAVGEGEEWVSGNGEDEAGAGEGL